MIRNKLISPILFLSLFASCKKDFEVARKATYDDYIKIRSMADTLNVHQQYDSAFYYYNKAKDMINADNEKVYCLMRMGGIQQKFCDFSGTEATMTEAYHIVDDTIYPPYIYNMLGTAYEEQANYDAALEYYYKALAFYKKRQHKITKENEILKGNAKNNIAVVYIDKKKYDIAIRILRDNIKNPIIKQDSTSYAKSLDNMGYALLKANDPTAVSYLNEAEKIRTSKNDESEKIASYIHLSEYYKIKNPKLAHTFAQKAYRSATLTNAPDDQLEAIYWLIQSSDPIAAQQYMINYIQLNDSLIQSRASAKNQFAKIKYDSSTALKNLEIQKGQTLIFLLLFVFVALLSILLYFLIRNRNRNKLKTIIYDTETNISKRLHDELANDVYHTMAFAETQDLKDPEKKETLIDNLDKIYSRTRSISKENSGIQTGERFESDLREMLTSYNSENVSVIIKPDPGILWSNISREKKIAAYRVLQELLVNMKKHSRATHAMIAFEKQANNIGIHYTDNGIGCDLLPKSKNGLSNAENRMDAIQGKLTFESEPGKGFRAKITFPQ